MDRSSGSDNKADNPGIRRTYQIRRSGYNINFCLPFKWIYPYVKLEYWSWGLFDDAGMELLHFEIDEQQGFFPRPLLVYSGGSENSLLFTVRCNKIMYPDGKLAGVVRRKFPAGFMLAAWIITSAKEEVLCQLSANCALLSVSQEVVCSLKSASQLRGEIVRISKGSLGKGPEWFASLDMEEFDIDREEHLIIAAGMALIFLPRPQAGGPA